MTIKSLHLPTSVKPLAVIIRIIKALRKKRRATLLVTAGFMFLGLLSSNAQDSFRLTDGEMMGNVQKPGGSFDPKKIVNIKSPYNGSGTIGSSGSLSTKSNCSYKNKTVISAATAQQKLADEQANDISVVSVNVYKNPTDRDLTIDMQFSNAIIDVCTVEVRNLVGQVITSEQVSVAHGHLYHEVSFKNRQPDGMYMISVIAGGSRFNEQIIIHND